MILLSRHNTIKMKQQNRVIIHNFCFFSFIQTDQISVAFIKQQKRKEKENMNKKKCLNSKTVIYLVA